VSAIAVVGLGCRLAPDLSDAENFNIALFGLSPREAETLQLQHRLFLECAREALEEAGCLPGKPGETFGVYAGVEGGEAGSHLGSQPALAAGSFQSMLGADVDYIATRVSFRLGLTGPSLSISPGGAAPLTAVHLACGSLLSGEVDAALAGGGAVAGLGDDAALGVLVLKRLEDALAGRHPIRAVIRGSAINHEGARAKRDGTGRARVVDAAVAAGGCQGDPPEFATAEGMTGLIRSLQTPRRCAVTAASAGGANACILLEEAPAGGRRGAGER
jgi:acyl transferase domain-containing protein